MIEGILFVIFSIVGGLSALAALFFFIVSLVRQSKTMFKLGLAICIVPVSIYGLIFWYYDIHIPRLNRQMEQRYAGTYTMNVSNSDTNVNTEVSLVLNRDNTFRLDKNNLINFIGDGKWKAGATDDGQFEFRDNKNSIRFWASPHNDNELVIDRNIKYSRTIIFVKHQP
jgi:hypothetical protein